MFVKEEPLIKMPRHCSVHGCRSNYDAGTNHVTTYTLPKDPELRKCWLDKIPTDFTGLKNPIVCIKHFEESSIIRSDVVPYKGQLKEYPRVRPRLCDGAMPTIFPYVPNYLSQPVSPTITKLVNVKQERCEDFQKTVENSSTDHVTCVSKTKKRPSLDQPSSTKKSKNTEHEERDVSQKSQIGTESGNMAFVCQKINVVTNEYEAVGMNVTAKLRRMNSIQQIYAESLINKVLTKGLLNKLTENTDIVVSLNFDDRSTAATSTSVSKNGDSS